VKRTVRFIVASFALAALAALGIASCKQGEGERCQVDADCAADLTCNTGEGVCRSSNSDNQVIDASPLPDASPDAPVIDAIDAM